VPPDEVERLGRLRSEAARLDADARALHLGPDVPVLDAIAWLSGFPPAPGDDRLRLLIEQARAEGKGWRAIAVAVGESNDRGGETRTQARQAKRNRRAGRGLPPASAG